MTVGSRIIARLARLPRATSGAEVERDLSAKMDDGSCLLADRWYPAGLSAGGAPVVLARTPYGRKQWGIIGRLFAERGYQVVIQSCRGTFGSGGEWVPFRNETADGRDALAWIADQPWFDGRLATFGPSYLGITQWALAGAAPGRVQTHVLDVTASNVRDAVVYPADCFALETALTWIYQVEHQEQGGRAALRAQLSSRTALRRAAAVLPIRDADVALVDRRVDFFQDWIAHEEPGDAWWDPTDFGRGVADNADGPPVSSVGGWFDIFLPSQLDDYRRLREAGRDVALTVGPWHHASPGLAAETIRDGLEQFGHVFTDRPSGPARDRVRLFVMGSDRWLETPEWPPPAVEERWHLAPGKRLERKVAERAEPYRYTYDPTNPTPGIGGPSLNWANAGSKDQSKREERDDVLTFTSAPMTEDLTVIGPLMAELHVRSSLEHTDFVVALCEVSPKGQSKNLSLGATRLRPGDVTPADDGTMAIRVSMWPTANTFRNGHRIRLQVSSGAHPLLARNLGSGEPFATGRAFTTAHQEVLCGAEHPSSIVLPVSTL